MPARRQGEAQGPSKIAAELTRLKGETLNRAAADERLSGTDFRVLYVAFNFVHRDPASPSFLRLWPAFQTIAARAGVSERRVRASMKRLVATGYLKLVSRCIGKTNVYTPVIFDRTPSDDARTDDGERSFVVGTPVKNGHEPRSETTGNPLEEPLEEPLRAAANAAPKQSQNLLPGKDGVVGQPAASQLARIQKLRGMLVQHERNQDAASAASCKRQIDALLAARSEPT